MINDKLKQDHVFVKNNVGSLALHKAKQEIGEIKMDEEKLIDFLKQRIEIYSKTAKSCLNEDSSFKKDTKTKSFIPTYYIMVGRIEAYQDILKDILRGRDD